MPFLSFLVNDDKCSYTVILYIYNIISAQRALQTSWQTGTEKENPSGYNCKPKEVLI